MKTHPLLTPLTMGSMILPHRLVQGPLAGISAAPFRLLTHRIGKPAYCVTEMISAHDLTHRPTPLHRYIYRDPEEGLLGFQLSGNDPDILQRAAVLAEKYRADFIDLNCGCPVKKIRQKQAGSFLLSDPDQLYQLVKSLVSSVSIPVSVKIRVGEPFFDSDDLDVAEAIAKAGASLITVHGRHWTERYDKSCRSSPIAAIVNHVDIPVFANGDVDSVESLLSLYKLTQCDGVMIARGGVGNPWLFSELQAALMDQPFIPPDPIEIAETFIEHIERLAELGSEHNAILESRRLAKYYFTTKRFPHADLLPFQSIATMKALKEMVNQICLGKSFTA